MKIWKGLAILGIWGTVITSIIVLGQISVFIAIIAIFPTLIVAAAD